MFVRNSRQVIPKSPKTSANVNLVVGLSFSRTHSSDVRSLVTPDIRCGKVNRIKGLPRGVRFSLPVLRRGRCALTTEAAAPPLPLVERSVEIRAASPAGQASPKADRRETSRWSRTLRAAFKDYAPGNLGFIWTATAASTGPVLTGRRASRPLSSRSRLMRRVHISAIGPWRLRLGGYPTSIFRNPFARSPITSGFRTPAVFRRRSSRRQLAAALSNMRSSASQCLTEVVHHRAHFRLARLRPTRHHILHHRVPIRRVHPLAGHYLHRMAARPAGLIH